jgi:7-carboxy-7-deazaguanine synthase
MDVAGSTVPSVPVPGPGELLVSEVFGPTFQGEGPSLGRRAGFVRLGRCNLDCGKGPGATWACDTPYTWDWEAYDPVAELEVMSLGALVDAVAAMDVDLVVVTGGEPLLQQRRLLPFLHAARERDWAIEIETNGTIRPLPEVIGLVARFNVSPKLPGSGVRPERALRPDALRALRACGRAVFKFVVADPRELDKVASVAESHQLAPIWIMPAGTTAEEVLSSGRSLADPVLARGWHLTTRLHVLLWGDQRGR